MKPLTLLIKPASGLCNMKCAYCFYKSVSACRENSIMSYDTVDLLIQKIVSFQPSSLTVMFQGGEPLLAGIDFYKYFVSLVSRKIRVPVYYALQTNGLLIDDEFASFFRENVFLLGVSLDGDKSVTDRNRFDNNGRSVFDRVMNSIDILRAHSADFNILSVIDDESVNETEKTYSFFKECGFSFIQFIPCIDSDGVSSLSQPAYESFLKRIFDLWYNDYIQGNYISIRHIDNYMSILLGRVPENCAMCGFCGNYYVIESNGDIYPCDFYCDSFNRVASIYDENPFEIGEKHRAFIDESKIIHYRCSKCRYYILCRGGCKRDRINGFTENRYCKAYSAFFDYAGERMLSIAESLK